jgi:N4-gp56 family major capsid protein
VDLYEDDIPAEIKTQIGERVALVNEMIIYGVLKSCTNTFFAGVGTSVSTTNDKITLGLLRKIARSMQANHARPVTTMLKASANISTEPVEQGYVVVCHTDLEPDLRDIAGFIPVSKYATGTPMANEIGRVERFRFVTSPDLPATYAGGASGTAGSAGTGYSSITNPPSNPSGTTKFGSALTNNAIDIYPFFVLGQDAFSQIALRGKESTDPTFIPAGEKTKSDPHGQRGYAGAIWWKGVMIENNQWMALGYCGITAL